MRLIKEYTDHKINFLETKPISKMKNNYSSPSLKIVKALKPNNKKNKPYLPPTKELVEKKKYLSGTLQKHYQYTEHGLGLLFLHSFISDKQYRAGDMLSFYREKNFGRVTTGTMDYQKLSMPINKKRYRVDCEITDLEKEEEKKLEKIHKKYFEALKRVDDKYGKKVVKEILKICIYDEVPDWLYRYIDLSVRKKRQYKSIIKLTHHYKLIMKGLDELVEFYKL